MRALFLLAGIIFITLLGIAMILALLIAWRRSITRKPERQAKTEAVDTWSASAERMRVRPSAPTRGQDADAAPLGDEQEDVDADGGSPEGYDEDEEEDETYFSDEDRPYDPSEDADEDEPWRDDDEDDDEPQNPFGRS